MMNDELSFIHHSSFIIHHLLYDFRQNVALAQNLDFAAFDLNIIAGVAAIDDHIALAAHPAHATHSSHAAHPTHTAHATAVVVVVIVLLALLGKLRDDGLGGQQQTCDAGSVLQSTTGHLDRVHDAGLAQVFVDVGV